MTSSKKADEAAPAPVDLDDIAGWVDADRKLTRQIEQAEAKVEALRLQLGIDDLTKARDTVRAKVQERIGDAHEARIAGRPVITWKPNKASTYLDQKSLRADEPKLWAKYQKAKKAVRPYVLLAVNEQAGGGNE
ncbi:hypothetical protein E1287_22525 [Actinomadura sp. KC06]|uniref:hypothetical protein n=1 Tax=Actinomadura sp. KC06 TaxID=2530369 RepID=UPI00104E0AE2|nr:hypothetical protein [Actinomadura sp. KC06]TDD32466.1 hypothetical protein E1287_22525 [Actinomadura sp. KC06]